MSTVTVIGAGYVGLVQGACLAELGHRVTCVDTDDSKIAALREGRSPIYEPGLEELLARNIAEGRLGFDLVAPGAAPPGAEFVFVAVGTPTSDSGAADLSQVRSVVSAIAEHGQPGSVLVMKSTVPPGTGATLCARFLDPAPRDIDYVSNPEFLREGQAVDDFFGPDRIVLGSASASALKRTAALYEPLLERCSQAGRTCAVVETDVASAETIKYASNAFLSTKISFINEIANICDCVGADIDSVADGVGLDARIGRHFLHAGVGYGGSCFPKDTRALDFISTLNGYQFDLLRAVIDVNKRQRLLPIRYLLRRLPDVTGRKVAVLGLSFKPNTDDVRESPALDILPLLAEEGFTLDVYDPLAVEVHLPGARRASSVWEALEGASAALLLTEWPEFVGLDWARAAEVMLEPRLVFDGRNALDREAVERAGLAYAAIGRPGDHRTARS